MERVSEVANPYAAPESTLNYAPTQLCGSEILRISHSWLAKITLFLISVPYICGTIYFCDQLVSGNTAKQTIISLAMASGCFAVVLLYMQLLWDQQIYTTDGIRLSRMAKPFKWTDIRAWYTKRNGAVCVELYDGSKRILNGAGPRRYNIQLEDMLKQRLGPASL